MIEAFVGKNAAYYQKKWCAFQEKPGVSASFNFAAFFGTIIWLGYRKLYTPMVWVTVAYIADAGLFLYAEEKQIVSADTLTIWTLITGLLIPAVVGLFGNYWYWKKFSRIAIAAAAEGDEELQLNHLRAKGGTNAIAVTVVVIVLVAPVVWALYQASPVLFSDSEDPTMGYVFDATGPLTLAEVRTNLIDRMDDQPEGDEQECVFREVEERSRAAGDPETLDPVTVDFLPVDNWDLLDAEGRRIILTQVITTKAFFECI